MSKFQLKEAQRDLREAANKAQLREVLAKQMADKRVRELKEHAHTYGEGPQLTSTLDKMVQKATSAASISREAQAEAGAKRRAELEKAIQQKQRERKELRKLAQNEQRRLDDDAAQTEALLAERAKHKQAETRAKQQIDMLTAQSQARAAQKHSGAH